MQRVLFYLVLTFALFGFIRWIKLGGTVENPGAVKDPESKSEETEKMGSISMDKYKNMNGELGAFYSDEYAVSQIKQCESMMKSVDNYVQRYVSLFLIMTNLRDYEIKDSNEEISIDVEISLTGQDLAYLQGYSKSQKNSAFPKNFSKLDGIMSKIARLKERSFKEKAWRSIISYLYSINYYSIFSNPYCYRLFSFLIILTTTWIFRRHLFSKSFCSFILITINSTILWEGLVLYQKKIKETDIKIYVETMRMKNVAAECDPENIRWYHSLTNFFWEDKCLHYYQTAAMNAEDEVSLFRCIIDTYTFYLVRMPLKLFGTSIREFTEEFTASLPWPLYYFVNIPLGIVFVISAAFFILILCGKRLRMSFFGAAVEIGDVKVQPKSVIPPITNNKRAKPLKKLKPWTRSRFSKNWIGDCGKLWKITASKSITEVPHKEATIPEGTIISTEVKQA